MICLDYDHKHGGLMMLRPAVKLNCHSLHALLNHDIVAGTELNIHVCMCVCRVKLWFVLLLCNVMKQRMSFTPFLNGMFIIYWLQFF